jgi:hypothetical protein
MGCMSTKTAKKKKEENLGIRFIFILFFIILMH